VGRESRPELQKCVESVYEGIGDRGADLGSL
jgi:hypothetical protein